MKRTIIFVCEHGSAKSVVAAALFNRLVKEKKLDFQAFARGTNPDQELAQPAIDGLLKDGLSAAEQKPTLLSEQDLISAQGLITFCDLPSHYKELISVEDWSDVPPISVNYDKSRDAMLEYLKQYLDKLEKES